MVYIFDTTNYVFAIERDISVFFEPIFVTFGYRPVLRLKIDNNSNNNGKKISSILKIGDYVDYEANGYKNWRVLSINKDLGTVDVISGGIVKNLSLYAKDDYENYSSILQNEVDIYINGDNVIGARAIKDSDVVLINDMNDIVSAAYWFDKKIEYEKYVLPLMNLQTSSTVENEIMVYGVGILWTNTGDYYVNDIITAMPTLNIRRYYIELYSKSMLNQEEVI